MTRRGAWVVGFRWLAGVAAVPLVGLAAGCGSKTSKYNDEGFSREFEKPAEASKGGGAPPVSDPDDPRERRRKKAAAAG